MAWQWVHCFRCGRTCACACVCACVRACLNNCRDIVPSHPKNKTNMCTGYASRANTTVTMVVPGGTTYRCWRCRVLWRIRSPQMQTPRRPEGSARGKCGGLPIVHVGVELRTPTAAQPKENHQLLHCAVGRRVVLSVRDQCHLAFACLGLFK